MKFIAYGEDVESIIIGLKHAIKEMKKGEKYTFSFNLKSSDILGEYTYKVYAYDKCEANGGVMLTGSEVKIVTVINSASNQELVLGNKEGTINNLYEGTGNFLSSLGTTWNNMNEYTQFLLGGIGIILLITMILFKEPRVRK